MTYESLSDALQEALENNDRAALPELVDEMNPADLADVIQDQEAEDLQAMLLLAMPLDKRAETFGYLPISLQQALAAELSAGALAALVTAMSADERADLFNAMDDTTQHTLFKHLAREEREDLRRLASYEEGTAGAVMTSDYAVVRVGMTVAQALDQLRKTAPDKETIYQSFVVDEQHQLLGTISLREMIVSAPRVKVEDLMTRDLVSAHVGDAQEDVAKLISRYDLLALPIVSEPDNKLVGIVTYDDAMDVAEAEATEDFLKSASVAKLEAGLGNASILELYRSRVGWLVALVFASIFTATGIGFFEDTIAANQGLLLFMTLLVASAGNAGSQSSTLMVRSLATGDVQGNDWARLLGKEFLVSLSLGLTMAFAVSLVGVVMANMQITVVVAITMVVVVLMGSMLGMCMPLLLNKVKLDPATASTPLVATIADVVGVLLYFGIATALLGIAI